MGNRGTKVGVLAGLSVGALITGITHAAFIYQDNFDGTAGMLSGRAVPVASGADGGTAGATWNTLNATASLSDALWQVSGGTYSGTGTTFASITGATTTNGADDANNILNATLPFTPASGLIYDLHLAVDSFTETPTATGNWLGLAFAQGTLNGHSTGGQALSNDNPAGLIILKGTGAVQAFGGVGTANQKVNLANGSVTTGVYHAVDVLLDTTSPLWTVTWELDNTVLSSFTYTTNPSIGVVAFGTNKLNGQVSDFSLSTVPEPTSLAITAIGAVLLLQRRKPTEV